MLVQALAAYADTYLAQQLGDPAFEEKFVQYAIEIGRDGAFVGVRQRGIEIQAAGRKAQAGARLAVPKSPVCRNSTVFPLLGCDAVQYVMGPNPGVWTADEAADLAKHARQHEAFVQSMRSASQACRDDALDACVRFYDEPSQIDRARAALGALKLRTGSVVVLSVVSQQDGRANPGVPIVERPAVREYWRSVFRDAFAARVGKGGQGMCLVSGTFDRIAPTHDKIRGVSELGGQPSGVALMSFDKPAFQSYGWVKNLNSPVSPHRATAYVLALNDLLRTGDHRCGVSKNKVVRTRFDVGNLGCLFWTRTPTDDDFYSLLFQAMPEQVAALLGTPLRGHLGVDTRPNEFYLVAVAGNGGRLLVRYWFNDTLASVRASVRSWFVGLRIADVFAHGGPCRPPPLWAMLSELSRDPDELPPELALQVIRRALQGQALGPTVLAAALARLRATRGNERQGPARMGLIRLCVNDLAASAGQGEEPMTESLNPQSEHPAYVCGRLLAVYDALQYAAQGEIGVTVVDRYFASASTNPQLAFPKIEELSIRHVKKLRREKPFVAVAIQRRIAELYELLEHDGARFPGQLCLEDQGRFAIGFHHQKADDARCRYEATAGTSPLSEIQWATIEAQIAGASPGPARGNSDDRRRWRHLDRQSL